MKRNAKWTLICAIALLALFAAGKFGLFGRGFEIRAVVGEGEGGETVKFANRSGGEDELRLSKEALLDSRHVEKALWTKDSITGKDKVFIKFTLQGGVRLSDVTRTNIGKRMAIVVKNKIISAPTIQEEIVYGAVEIAGDLAEAEAEELARILNARNE